MTIAKLVAGSAASFLLAVLTPPSLPDDLGMLLPGDRTLIPSGLTAGDSSQQHFFRIDSTGAERAGGGEHVTLIRPVAGDPSRLLLIWQLRSPRGEMADTMRVRMPGLIPEWERLVTPQGTNTYEYDGGTVRSRLVRGDSAPVVKEQRYPQPVFGFNELDALIRSIPYAAGYTRVVPLYSEGDNDIEYDTLTVLGRSAVVSGEPAQWKVRFADKVVVVEYLVDEASRRVLSATGGARLSSGKYRTSYDYAKAPR